MLKARPTRHGRCATVGHLSAPSVVIATFLVLVLVVATAHAGDWPQWRGPHRDGHSSETGLATTWSEDGPPELWRIEAGESFSGLSVVGQRIFTAWIEGEREVVLALDARTGRKLWQTEIGKVYRRERGDGPRATPTVDGDRLYMLSGLGRLVALSAAEGRVLWTRDLMADLGAELPIYGFSASPLVVGDRVVVPAGGTDHALVAFDKATGETAWSVYSDPIGYSSPVLMELADELQIVAVTGESILGVDLEGRLLWNHPWPMEYHINVATPIRVAANRLFVSTSYDVGAVVLEIRKEEKGFVAEEVWRNQLMKNHFQDSIYHDGHLYGFDNAFLKCIDASTGEMLWRHRGFGKGQLLFVDGQLIILGERGRLAMASATPEGYRERAVTTLPSERYWVSPTLAGGVLYVRNDTDLLTLNLRAPASSGGSIGTAVAEIPRTASPITAERLVTLNLAARGSEKAWKEVRVLRLSARYNRNGRESHITVWRHAAGQERFDIVFKGRKESFIYDGTHGWFRNLGDSAGSEISGPRLKLRLAEVQSYLPWRDPWSEFEVVEYAGERPRQTDTWHQLQVGNGSSREQWFISASSHQVVAAIRGEGEQRFVTYGFEYRPVRGLLFPHYVETSFGTALHSLNVENIEVNPEIPDDLFDIPGRQ